MGGKRAPPKPGTYGIADQKGTPTDTASTGNEADIFKSQQILMENVCNFTDEQVIQSHVLSSNVFVALFPQ